ncbi:MAG TPA: hypothetical protein VMH83_02285 [Candidatus Acidoferrum sp.]|nr:hypothetical protein [Candidatus Acidoferrum sp.]
MPAPGAGWDDFGDAGLDLAVADSLLIIVVADLTGLVVGLAPFGDARFVPVLAGTVLDLATGLAGLPAAGLAADFGAGLAAGFLGAALTVLETAGLPFGLVFGVAFGAIAVFLTDAFGLLLFAGLAAFFTDFCAAGFALPAEEPFFTVFVLAIVGTLLQN